MTFSPYPRPVRVGDIYQLRFPNRKSYIGASLLGSKRRYDGHRRIVLRGHHTSLVHAAWQQYGDPELIVLERGVPEGELWVAEKRAIAKYNTKTPNGYNGNSGSVNPPGYLNRKHSQETRKKQSDAHRGKKDSEETREKKRKANLGKRGYKHSDKTKKKMSQDRSGEGNAMFGKHHTEETKEKIRHVQLGRIHTAETKENHRLASLKMWEDKRQSGTMPDWKKPSKPCSNCSKLSKPLRKGLCCACSVYFHSTGVPRPERLYKLRSGY